MVAEPKENKLRDVALTIYALVIAGLIVGVLGTAVWASFITYWPYNLSLTLKNYDFGTFDAAAWSPYFNSLKMAALAAILGTAIVFTGAYLVEKTKVSPGGRAIAHLLAMLPMAVPGLVLGLGYVFFVNAAWNPLNIFYGTLLVLVVNSIAHFYTVAHITALTALEADRSRIRIRLSLARKCRSGAPSAASLCRSACRRFSISRSIFS